MPETNTPNHNPHFEAVMGDIQAARQASQEQPGLYEKNLSPGGDYIERIPGGKPPETGPSLRIVEHFEPDTDRLKARAHTAVEAKGGAQTEYNAQFTHTYYKDLGGEDTYGLATVHRRSREGETYTHTFKNPITAQRFVGRIARQLAQRAETNQQNNKKIA